MGTFAVIALALAALGLYGVLAYTVRQRSRELGIRIALGASAGQVRGLVFRQAAGVLAIGVAAGLAGAWALGPSLQSLVFEIAPSDPRVLLGSAVVLVMVALVAAWLPAQRAARVEPCAAIQEGG
jgi:putative ABC transport system permease protein